MSNIHDYHGTLQPEDLNRLQEAADSQEQFVLNVARAHPDRHFAYFEIKNMTGWDKDSVKRALSNLSGSGKKAYQDEYGNWPMVYDKNHRKKNRSTSTTCGTYKVNPIYGKRPPKPAETDPAAQSNLFGEVKPKFQGTYSGVN